MPIKAEKNRYQQTEIDSIYVDTNLYTMYKSWHRKDTKIDPSFYQLVSNNVEMKQFLQRCYYYTVESMLYPAICLRFLAL